jgi:hypothetical protein
MHFAIIVIAGANFWPWIILNLIIAFVVTRDEMIRPIPIKLIATFFILISPRFVYVWRPYLLRQGRGRSDFDDDRKITVDRKSPGSAAAK